MKAVIRMKKLIYFVICIICVLSIVSCGKRSDNKISAEIKNELCSYYWESVVDVMQFTEDGKILRNFESPLMSDSMYRLSGNTITMYTVGSPEDGMTFEFKIRDDKLYIGDVEYVKRAEVPKEDAKPSDNTEGSKNAVNKEEEQK